MESNKILGIYDENDIARMVSGGGTLKQRLADKRAIENNAELRELVFQLKNQLYRQRETFLETSLEQQKTQPTLPEEESLEETELVSISDEEYEDWVNGRKIKDPYPFRVWVNKKVKGIWNSPMQRIAVMLFILSSIGLSYRNITEQKIAENGNYLADNTPEREVRGTQGNSDENDTAEADTLFNAGRLALRTKYESVSDNNYGTFKQLLTTQLNDKDPYQRQSKQYWMSWVLYNEQKYDDAILSFEALRLTLPAGIQRQRAAIGLMHALWKSDQQQREGFVGLVTTLLNTNQRKRLQEIARATLEEKEGDKHAQNVAKRYLDILK